MYAFSPCSNSPCKNAPFTSTIWAIQSAIKTSHSTKGSKGPKAVGQDYQVLLTELQKRQADFQHTSSLLRVGEYHVRRSEYYEAVLVLRDSLSKNRSVVRQSLNILPSLDVSVP